MKFLILVQLLVLSELVTCKLVPTFVPNGIKTFSNGTNFTSLLIVGNAIYVGAK